MLKCLFPYLRPDSQPILGFWSGQTDYAVSDGHIEHVNGDRWSYSHRYSVT